MHSHSMGASLFTMTSTTDFGGTDAEWTEGPGYWQGLGDIVVVRVEASDTRISGTWTQANDFPVWPTREDEDVLATVWSGAVRIENQDGTWTGTLDGCHDGTYGNEWNRLEGEGAYEGLTAIFRYTEDGEVYEGVIVPGIPPERPEPVLAADYVPVLAEQ